MAKQAGCSDCPRCGRECFACGFKLCQGYHLRSCRACLKTPFPPERIDGHFFRK